MSIFENYGPQFANRMAKTDSVVYYEKSDWSRAFNQFTIACELDMINVISLNVISAADITFIMSSSTSAWLLSPLECSQQMNVFSCLLFKKCIIKQLLNSVFA